VPRKTLRAVTEADVEAVKPKVPPKSLKEAVEDSERALLVRMRLTVAEEIDGGVPAHTLAPLIRQLHEVDKQIRALDARAKEEALEGGSLRQDETWDAEAL
jgi:hypothetical protein